MVQGRQKLVRASDALKKDHSLECFEESSQSEKPPTRNVPRFPIILREPDKHYRMGHTDLRLRNTTMLQPNRVTPTMNQYPGTILIHGP